MPPTFQIPRPRHQHNALFPRLPSCPRVLSLLTLTSPPSTAALLPGTDKVCNVNIGGHHLSQIAIELQCPSPWPSFKFNWQGMFVQLKAPWPWLKFCQSKVQLLSPWPPPMHLKISSKSADMQPSPRPTFSFSPTAVLQEPFIGRHQFIEVTYHQCKMILRAAKARCDSTTGHH